MRSRDCEGGIPMEYLKVSPQTNITTWLFCCVLTLILFAYLRISVLPIWHAQRLHAAYEEYLEDIARIIPVIRVNYTTFQSADEMAEMVVRYNITPSVV